ncbi:MAG TPA: peptidoglycan editing factor PgeF [Acetobacteraceae bacterium]|nr:peptidoglycan editing factor PgeF [Acetobacteraceae bacterium]
MNASLPAAADFLASPALPVGHGFFTRRGGVSTGSYASLNCSLSGGDDPARVRENRARAARALGADPEALVGLTQVHGAAAIVVEQPWPAGAGPRADAMATRTPGVALGIITADCVPVLLADRQAGVVGAAHAGWRGMVAGVLREVVAAMLALGARRERIAAAIGPSIRQVSYEVGPDLLDALLAADPDDARFLAPGRQPDRWQFDLAGCCAARLEAEALGAVDLLQVDTLAEPDRFFSHRRRTLAGEGPIGHQISIVVCPGADGGA